MDHVSPMRLRLSTDMVEADRRLKTLQESYAGNFPNSHIRPLSNEPVHSVADALLLGPLGLCYHHETPMRFTNSGSLSASGQNVDDLVLFSTLTGCYQHEVAGRRQDVTPGTAVVSSTAISTVIDSPMRSEAFTVRFRRELIARHFPDPEELLGRLVISEVPELPLLMAVLRVVMTNRDVPSPSLAAMTTRHVTDLVLSMCARVANRHAGEIGRDGVRAAQARLVCEVIRRHYQDPMLNVERIAARLGCSPRHVQKLLAEAGTTVGEEIREARLDRAMSLLTGLNTRHLRIQDIAFQVGFSDQSHFVRSFRRRFGVTPSEVRV